MLESRNFYSSLALTMTLLLQACPFANAINQEDRMFYRKIMKRDGTDEQVLILNIIADEIEGNYAVLQKYRELKDLYTKQKSTQAREAWVYGKLALNEFLHGSKAQANAMCNIALKDIRKMPEPIQLDEGYFYTSGTKALARALLGLNRREDFNRTQTVLSHAALRFGRPSTEKLMLGAVIFFELDDMDSAKAQCNDAIKQEPGYSGSYYLRAVISFRKGAYESAIKDLDSSIMFCSDNANAYSLRGLCKLALDKKAEALTDLNESIKMNPTSMAYLFRSAVKLMDDDYVGGEADIAEARKAPGANWVASAMHGDCMLHLKQFEDGAKDYSSAIEMIGTKKLPKSKARCYYRRGLCYRALGQSEKAKSDFDQSIIFDSKRAAQVKKLMAKIDPEDKKQEADKSENDKSSSEKLSTSNTAASETKNAAKDEGDATAAQPSKDEDDDYSSYIAVAEPQLPSFREGENSISGMSKRSKSSHQLSSAKASNTKSWLDAGTPDPGKNPAALEEKKSDSSKTDSAQIKKEAAPAEAATDDPYLRYLERQIGSNIESAASKDIRVSFKIEGDGSALVQGDSNFLSAALMRAAPYRVPPADKSNTFTAAMSSGSKQLQIKFGQ